MIFDTSLGNFGATADPLAMAETARAADDLGFRALWTADHLLAPSTLPQYARVFEPFVSLAYVASITQRVRLGTSVIVLPMRSPFVVAKQAATLDVLSNGRVILGIGVGSIAAEYDNVHANFTTGVPGSRNRSPCSAICGRARARRSRAASTVFRTACSSLSRCKARTSRS
jgi:alkanesulfonate monooxygenase SsuD/methylene tetrahydromethanopterin reductase-like flavin-dependent oxidoreductase (luciferase family)